MSKIVKRSYEPAVEPSNQRPFVYRPIDKTPYVESNDAYSVAIVARGEQLSYADARGELIVEISIPGRWVDADSIRRWNGVHNVADADKAAIVDRIVRFFGERQGLVVTVIHGSRG